MQNSKLIILLKALEPDEFRQFYRYLKTPFFTKSKELIQFYDYIRKYYPEFADDKLNRKTIFATLYPNESFNSPRLRNLALKVTKVLEDFLIYLDFQQNDFQKKKHLTHIYGKRNINVIFKQKTEELLAALAKQPFQNAEYFYDSYSLQRDYYFHVNTAKQKDNVKILKDALINFDYYYSIERLRLGLDLKNRERIYSECHDFDANNLTVNTPEANINFQLLKKIYCLCEMGQENHFLEAEVLFMDNIAQIAPKDGLIILPFLLNFVIQQLPQQEEKYLPKALNLYKLGIRTKLLIPNKSISNTTFLNIVVIGSKSKDYQYIEHFIQDNERFLDAQSRDDISTLAKGFLAFNQANYDAVIDNLQAFRFSNILYKINAKTLLIQTYYQLFEKDASYYNLIISHSESYERFLRRETTIHQQKKEAAMNFIFLLRKITKQRFVKTTKGNTKKELLYLLDNFSFINVKSWLRLKIIDL